MAYLKSTLTDLRQSLADRHDSGVLPTDADILSQFTRLLNRGQEYCATELGLKKSTSLTTVSGTIALPTDFKSIIEIYDADSIKQKQIGLDDLAWQDTDETYWITGDHDTGFSLNSPNDETFTVYYNYFPTPLSVAGDECIIPDPEAVVAYAYSMLRKSETDPIGDAQEAMIECNTRIKRMKSDYDANNANSEMSVEI